MYFARGIIQIPIDHQIKDHGMIEEIVPGLLDRCASLYIAKQNNHLTFKGIPNQDPPGTSAGQSSWRLHAVPRLLNHSRGKHIWLFRAFAQALHRLPQHAHTMRPQSPTTSATAKTTA